MPKPNKSKATGDKNSGYTNTVKINNTNETIWTILAETQIANKRFDDALISLNNAQKINPKMGEIYFAKSTIYLKQSKLKKAKLSLQTGIKLYSFHNE